MGSTLYRVSAAILILTTGCSSSGIFGGRGAKSKSAVTEAFASTGDASEASDRPTTSSPARRTGAQAAITGSTLDPVQRRQKVTEHLATAARAEKSGDARAARLAYERVLHLEPSHSLANYQLAVIADNESRFDDAERHYQVLLRKTPQNPDLLASLGWSYLLQGRYDESERTLRDALSIDPQHRTASYNLGWLYGTLGDYDHSLEIFRSAGSEADAQRAMAELFPRGKPADGPRSPVTAPRNPFRATARDVAASNQRNGSRAQGRLPAGTVSAPAPWQKQTDPAVVSDAPPRGARPTADRRNEVRDESQFDEVFSSLDGPSISENVRVPASRDTAALPLDPPNNLPGPANIRSGEVQTAAFDQALPDLSSELPVITPKRGTSPQAARGPTSADLPPLADITPASSQPPAEPAREIARQNGGLPDWPYQTKNTTRGETATRNVPEPRPNARTTAALLGLSAGPGGLLFPTFLPPSSQNAGR